MVHEIAWKQSLRPKIIESNKNKVLQNLCGNSLLPSLQRMITRPGVLSSSLQAFLQ